jgi:segregation and condensation protein A
MRLGAGASAELLRSEPGPVPVEAAQRVLDYLVFHRSLLGDTPREEKRGELLERYLTLVREVKEGVHIVISDPFQKATALLFELVMEEEFDPWEIDLGRFTQQYLERIRTEGEVNFAVSGRLLYMAWSILCLQSVELLRQRERLLPSPSPVDAGADALVDDGYLADLTTPQAVDVTSTVLGSAESPPLEQMIRHSETRPVSLLELVQAFGQAEEEARRALRVESLRERLREEQRAPPQVLVHGDIPEQDLVDTWEVCLRHPIDESFPFLTLWRKSQGRDRLVAEFLACLFLARENSVELQQEELSSSELRLVRKLESRPERVEEEAPACP